MNTEYALIINKNAGFRLEMTLKHNGLPIDVTGYTVKMGFMSTGGIRLLQVESPTNITVGTTDGRISVLIPHSYLYGFSSKNPYKYDILYTPPGESEPYSLLRGSATFNDGVVVWT